MRIEENYSLEQYNTFHLPVKSRWFMEYENEEELIRILRDEYFQENISLHIGEGSNLLFLNDYNGVVVHSLIKGIILIKETDNSVLIRVGAGEKWDDVVAYAAEKGWGGIENLSHIPGETGAAAVQNIGAYGVEIKDVIETVEAYNQLSFEKRMFTNAECEYAYRYSFFKNEYNDPYIITHITLRLTKNPQTFHLNYADLREELGHQHIEFTPALIRKVVIAIRKKKLPDPDELSNAGSFFMNPLVSLKDFEQLKIQYPKIPFYSCADGRVKLSAGWLIEQCGFKNKRHGSVGVYEKHALVIVNYGEASGHEIALFAEAIRTAVSNRFGVELIPEVKYIG